MAAIWTYPALTGLDGRPVVVDVHDGDTFRLVLDAGCETGIFPWLRLAGVQAPELGKPGAAEAAAWTAGQLTEARAVLVTVQGRSFARWVAAVQLDGRDLAADMIEAGHAAVWPAA